jgi:hypothetical protein
MCLAGIGGIVHSPLGARRFLPFVLCVRRFLKAKPSGMVGEVSAHANLKVAEWY